MSVLRLLLVLGALLALSAGNVGAEDEIQIGRDAQGRLKVRVGFALPFVLPVSPFPGIAGYATGALGFHSAVSDEPANDFYVVSTDADFRLVLVAKDPGMEVWNDSGSGFMAVGDSFYVGVAPFDTHPVWNLPAGAPGGSYALTLKLRDLNGIYPESDPFVVSFTPEPSPVVSITFRASGAVLISWTLPADGWVLQQAPTLTGGAAVWTAIPPPYDLTATEASTTLSATGPASFFRLRKP